MLRVSLRPSRRLALFMIAAHACALGISLTLRLPWWAIGLLATAIVASAVIHVRAALLKTVSSIVALEFADDCACKLETRRGELRDAAVLGSSFVAPYLTIINLRIEGRRFVRHAVLLPDSLDPNAFRELRVLLRWKWKGSSPG